MTTEKKILKRWIKKQNSANRFSTIIIALIGLLNVGAGIVQAWALAHILAHFLTQNTKNIKTFFLLFIVGCIARIAIEATQKLFALSAGQKARSNLRNETINQIFSYGPSLLRRQHSASIASLLVDRIESLEGYFSRWLPASFLWIIAQWSVVFVVLWKNFHAGIILALCCLTLPFFQAAFGIATALASRRQFLAMERLQIRFLDRIRGIATIVLSGNAENDSQALGASAEELRYRTMKVLRIAFLTSATTDIIMIVALVLIVINQSHYLLYTHSANQIGSALFAVLMVPEAFAPFRTFSAVYQDRAKATASAEAMQILPEFKETVTNNKNKQKIYYDEHGIELKFNHVSYTWSSDRPAALFDINFSLKSGETLIIEGHSGSGKSTLIELLLGFISPQKGKILLGGCDMHHLPARDISRHISWIGQKPVLFAGTLRDNILFARPKAKEYELKRALEASKVSQYLSTLPNGLETYIGEGGFGLSGGQAQRIAIARAFLKDTPLLIMDEPTAHLDPITEADILESFDTLLRGRTTLIATHSEQFNTFKHARRIKLNKGHIVPLEHTL